MEFEMAPAPQPENESLLPRDRSALADLITTDEGTFKQELGALHRQIYRPLEGYPPSREDFFEVVRPDGFITPEADHRLLAAYLDLEPGPQSLARLADVSMGITGLQATPVGQVRLIDAIYSIFGPFHAQGNWFDIPEQIYVPICSVICLDNSARTGVMCEITYVTGGSMTSSVKVKLAGAGFGGSRTETVTVSSKYPATFGSQQVCAPANLRARLYSNPSTGEKAYRIRINGIGSPSHIGQSSPNFVVPDVKKWDRGDFGSSIKAGTIVTFDVTKKNDFDATVPIKILGTAIDLGYTVSQSRSLTVKATAVIRGIFDQLSVKDTAYALKFSLKK